MSEAGDLPPCRLRVAGYLDRPDRAYLDEIRKRVAAWGMADRFEYVGELDRAGKIAFLESLDVLCLPSLIRESKGLPVLEAWAGGVPAVLPDHGAFSEMVADTGGGLLYDPQRPEAIGGGPGPHVARRGLRCGVRPACPACGPRALHVPARGRRDAGLVREDVRQAVGWDKIRGTRLRVHPSLVSPYRPTSLTAIASGPGSNRWSPSSGARSSSGPSHCGEDARSPVESARQGGRFAADTTMARGLNGGTCTLVTALRPGTAHKLLDLAEKDGLEFLLRVMLFDFRAGLPLNSSADWASSTSRRKARYQASASLATRRPVSPCRTQVGVDLDVGIDAGDAASPILAELGVRLRTMKDIVGQGGQADLETGRREAAEKAVVVVDHGVMPHGGQVGRRRGPQKCASTRGPSSSINRRKAGRKICPSESSSRLVA